VQQTHRERRHTARRQLANRASRVGCVERRSHGAVCEHALGDLTDEPAWNQGRRFLDLQVVDLIPLLAPDDQYVAKAARRQEPDAARLALDDDVGSERGTVDRLRDVAPRYAALSQEGVEAGEARFGRIGIRREPFARGELSGRRLQDEIREGAADVESDAIGGQFRRSDRDRTIRYG
jgi:hypothetical protein